jgi:RNA polymerase sigma-70 factor (ECF subfamily)
VIPAAADSVVDTASIWDALAHDLRGYLRRRVGDAADDLLQEVFVRVQAHRGQLRDDERVGAWVFQIARRVVVDHHRATRRLDPLDEASREAPAADDDQEDSPEHVLGLWLSHMIRTLPPIYREALELTELRGMSQREAAVALGLPYSSLKARVQRGRARLEKLLRRCCEVELDRSGRVVDYRSRGAGSCCP